MAGDELNFTKASGRMVKEDGHFINMADIIDKAEEPITKGIRSINTDHGAIHLGWGYCAHLYHKELAVGAKKIYRFKGPSTKYAHIKSIQAGAIGSTIAARIIKDVTITVMGTKEDCLCNLNHNSLHEAQSEIYDGSVVYTGGKTWCEVIIRGYTSEDSKFAASMQTAGQFIQNDYLEYVTKSNDEDYIIELENIGDDTAYDLSIDMFFYEEPLGYEPINS
jgi:hypothetical protein